MAEDQKHYDPAITDRCNNVRTEVKIVKVGYEAILLLYQILVSDIISL